MSTQGDTTIKDASIPFPKLAAPAQRALSSEGLKSLNDLSKVRLDDIRKLHGIGQNALHQLTVAMEAAGLKFAD